MKAERQSNIELARLLAVAGVIILHYNNPKIGGGITYAEGSVNLYALYILESVFVCGVDLFILISGYFLCTSNRRSWWKPIELILQVMLFSIGIFLLRSLINSESISVKGVIGSLIPVNYFVILYVTLYMISPFINIMLQNLTAQQFRCLLGLALVLFSVYPTLVDVLSEITGREWNGLSTIGMYGSQWGYSIINFILMYMVGAYLRLSDTDIKKWNTAKIAAVWLAVVIVMTVWARINDYIGYDTERSAWEYCNPLVIASAVLTFLLFLRLKIGVNKVINRMAEGVFSIFLLHGVFIPHIGIEKAVTGNMFLMILHIFISALLICLLCWCAHVVYKGISGPIFRKMEAEVKLPVIELNTFDGRK